MNVGYRATVQGGPADPMVLVGAAQIEIPSMQQAAHYPGLAMFFFLDNGFLDLRSFPNFLKSFLAKAQGFAETMDLADLEATLGRFGKY